MTAPTNRKPVSTRPQKTRAIKTYDWREQGRCLKADPELFFPLGEGSMSKTQEMKAKAVCSPCPVKQGCLIWALTRKVEFGVWGGMGERERRALQRKEPGLIQRLMAEQAV